MCEAGVEGARMGGGAATASRPAGTMRAAVVRAPGAVRLIDAPVPEPGPGQLRLRLEGCGVCGSNLPLWEGRPWFDYPGEPGHPGHEAWGVVDARGPGVDGPAPGTRVAALTYHGFAQYDLADRGAVVPLPDALAGRPFPGEPLACAMNVFERADIRAGQTVAVVGVGFLGALLVRLASQAGARVLALSHRPYALRIAERMGAERALQLGDRGATVERVRDLTQDALCDRVIEAVGLQEPLDLAGELTRVRGRLVIAGFHQDGPRTVDLQLWNWRGLDVVNAHERDPERYVDGMRRAVRATEEGTLDVLDELTTTFPLDACERAFEALRTRPDGFLKGLVTIP